VWAFMDGQERPAARGPRLPAGSFDPHHAETLRRRAAMSREELAQQVGLSVSAVKMWESGARQPSARTAEKIAEALGVSPAALLGDTNFDPAQHSLEDVRIRFDLTTHDIATATGHAQRTVREVERGLRLPPDAEAWANAYGLTKTQLAASWAIGYQAAQHSQATSQA